MIIDEKVDLGRGCALTANYISGMKPDIAIEYIENAADPWYSSREVCVSIDKEKAVEIVEFLMKHFGF